MTKASVVGGGNPAAGAADSPASSELAAIIGKAVGRRVRDPDVIAYLWPQLERDVAAFDGHDHTRLFPGLDSNRVDYLLLELSPQDRAAVLRQALVIAGRVRSVSAWRKVLAAVLDFFTVFWIAGFSIAWATGNLNGFSFSLEGEPGLAAFAVIVLYFVLARPLGGTLWQRLLRVR